MEASEKPPIGKKLKARAPPPPQPTPKPRMEHTSSTESDGTGNQSTEESKENVLHRKVDLTVFLPDGQEKIVNVDGSKAVMDFLVDLCSQHHLNPAQHTLEARSRTAQQSFLLRPNTLIGTLDLHTIFLKEKVTEVKVRKPAPKIPEKTVRLVVNYLGTQKAVVRVNPAVPLWDILPAVCEKCEFQPENVTLLRDASSREELDMSQSLNDLGIKEVYAWNCKQEKNRKLSSSSDTAEREKKGILGFFRGNKKGNKNETLGHMDSDDYEEVFHTPTTSGSRCEGYLTAPSSPSVNSRSLGLGASISLGNISGIGAKTEVKKRRAPPPPKPAPQSSTAVETPEDKITEPLYATVNKEQQKKKRRAPPPPAPQMPNEKNEDSEKRKSSIGNGRQVPQKPPRGTSRSPPQLVIPPPPPYPPPDNDITDPPIHENGAAITGTTRPVPAKRGKHLIRSSSITSEEVLTTDDAGSLNSYTEDSGIVSSPSDSVSLDLHTDHHKKSENTNGTNKANPQPARAESLNSEDSWSLNTSSTPIEDEVTSVRNGDEDIFITSQFQKTLAELDEDSEDLDDGDHTESNRISARSSPVGEESLQFHEYKESSAAVPVTIIDEIPEVTAYSMKYNAHTIQPAVDFNATQKSSAVSKSTNDSLISHGESIARKTNTPSSNVQSLNSPSVKPGGSFKQSTDISEKSASKSEYVLDTIGRPKIAIGRPLADEPVSTFHIKTENDSKLVKDNTQKLGIKENQPPQISANKVIETTKPTLWRPHSYEPKVGLTTFTVVPPKPTVKKYDRGVSLTSSAIKIDDQGNLISPQSSFDKSDSSTNNKESPLVETPLVLKAKEFWRSSSLDAQGGESKEQPVKKIGPVRNYKPNEAVEKRAMYTSSKGLTQQIHVNKVNDKDNKLQWNKPAPKTSLQENVIIVENTMKKTEVPLLRPTFNNQQRLTQQIHVNKVIDNDNTLQRNKTAPKTALQENVIIVENTMKKTEVPLFRPTFNDQQPRQVNDIIRENTYKGKLDQGPAISDGIHRQQQTKPNLLSTNSQENIIIIEKGNQEKTELPFLKPTKRTSSQYMASAAIFKSTEHKKPTETTVVKYDSNSNNRSSAFLTSTTKTNTNVTTEKAKIEIKSATIPETHTEFSSDLGNKDDQMTNKMQSTNKSSHVWQIPSEAKKDDFRIQRSNGPGMGKITVLEKTEAELPRNRPTSNVPSNAFLKAVREKSMKIEQTNVFVPQKPLVTTVTITEKEDKKDDDTIPSTVIDEPDSSTNNSVFGPKAKFRPVSQKPVQKDNSLHSALMGAIQSGEGKEKLRKIQSSPTDGGEMKLYEPENERSALLSAIRAHSGTSRLKKVSSAASDELQSIKNTENESPATKTPFPPSPVMPPPPPPPTLSSVPKSPVLQTTLLL